MQTFPFPIDPIAQALTAQGITDMCDAGLKRAEQLAEGIRNTSLLTWESTFGAFDELAQSVSEAVAVPQLMMVAHSDAAVREAAMACEPKVSAFTTALFMDDRIASTLNRFADQKTETSPVRLRFMEHVLRDFRRNGLSLDPKGREGLANLNSEMTALEQQFQKHLAEKRASIEITSEQLDGLPESYVKNHAPGPDGKITITSDYPDLVPFMRYAKDRTIARELYARSQNRCAKENLPLLDEILALRVQKAKLLGYPTWADYVLETRMAKSAANVKAFLDDLHISIKPKREEEFQMFREAAARAGMPTDQIFASDASYLEDQIVKSSYALDSQALSQYFEIHAVFNGILEITKRLYGITFEPIDAPTWHADVKAYDLKDAAGKTIGRAYMDLHPRENKYKHAAMFGIRDTKRLADDTRVMPAASLVCNFPKPGTSPALLDHNEVVTFFHEFGHLLHHLVSQSELASTAGTNVARDFVEAPSQMFEEWAWTKETLALFAKHHATGEALPAELLEAMTKARTFGEATDTERQLFLATLDQTYHTSEPGFDTTKVMERVNQEYSSFTRIPDTHFQTSWGHLMGYDAAYYGYQWARSIAYDLLTRFQNEGMMNQKTAGDYRANILEPGSTVDENELVKRFLGRPSNAEAYKKYLGINTLSS